MSNTRNARNRRRRRQKAILRLCMVLLFAAVIGVAAKFLLPLLPLKNLVGEPEKLLTELTGLPADAELMTVAAQGDTALVAFATPQPNTASMQVVLYDLQRRKPLSETVLDSDAWKVGLTDNGFYAISTSQKTVCLYGRNGKLRMTKEFADTPDWSAACAVSTDERWLLTTAVSDGTLSLHALDGQAVKSATEPVTGVEVLGFRDGRFYLGSHTGELFSISPSDAALQTVLIDRRCTTVTPYYAIGTTESGFLLAFSDRTVEIPFAAAAAETVIGTGKTAFAALGETDGSLLRVYNVEKKTVSDIPLEDAVESTCFLEDGRLMVVTGGAAKAGHRLYLCNPSLAEGRAITLDEQTRATKAALSSRQPSKSAHSSKIVHGVPLISQFPEYPTGCESVSAVMLMQHAGADITVAEFIDNYLETSSAFYTRDGKSYGPNPYEYFLGSPRTTASYGCMAPVIEKAMLKYYGAPERVVNATGTDLPGLCAQYIDNDIPVMVWVSIKMLPISPSASWYIENGQRYSWPVNEHCMVLAGYDEENYYFLDPYTGRRLKYDKTVSEERYATLGKQAIAVLR